MRLGDIMVCINNENGFFPLTIGKQYIILDWTHKSGGSIEVNDDRCLAMSYNTSRFKTLVEYREEKLKIILNE